MSNMARFNVPEEALNSILTTNIANDPTLNAIRTEMMAIQPELVMIQQQNEAMLRQQNLQGDLLEQVKDQVDAALSFVNPMMTEGLSGQQSSDFMIQHQKFQLALLNNDLSGAQKALETMKEFSPNGNQVKVSEIALKAIQKQIKTIRKQIKTKLHKGMHSNSTKILNSS